MNHYKVQISGLIVIEPKKFSDNRGYFLETYQKEKYSDIGIKERFVQDNFSGSDQGVLRGLHYQINKPQGKLVTCLKGEVFDIALDIRKGSPTFGQHYSLILSEKQKNQFWIPAGFAHGFYAISEWAEISYKATNYYAPEWERTILWNDPQINIDWPIIEEAGVLLSEKDAAGDLLAEADLFE